MAETATVKTCKTCGASKPLGDYYFDGRSHRAHCRPCHLASKAVWYQENRERVNDYRRVNRAAMSDEGRWAHDLWLRHHITPETFNDFLVSQGGTCGCCANPLPDNRKFWHIDHDHACCPKPARSCGSCVRGVLCHNCNLMLGQAKDDPARLMAGVAYLERSRSGVDSGATD